MKKISILLLGALSFSTQKSSAQTPKVEFSEPFDEPEDQAAAKVIQCTNGNTVLFVLDKHDGIYVTVYDKSRKQIAQQTITGKVWDSEHVKQSAIEAAYEINGQLVLFLEQFPDKTPILYRLIVDPSTGKIMDEQKIADMSKQSGLGFGVVDPKSFHIEKDPNSNCYAIAAFDYFAPEGSPRYKIIHFDGQHHEINRAYYDSPNYKYKSTYWGAMAVDGNRSVYLCTQDFNGASGNAKMAKVFFSRMKNGASEIEHKELDLMLDVDETDMLMTYNPGTKSYLLFSAAHKRKSSATENAKSYRSVLTSIDPESMTIKCTKPLVSSKLSEYSRRHLEEKSGFDGMPQDIIVNRDNSVTILQEESELITSTYSSNFGSGMTQSSYHFNVGNVGILNVDTTGTETQGIVIPKDQRVRTYTGVFNHSYKNKGNISFYQLAATGIGYANSGFFSFQYINSTNGNYVLFNDLSQNFSRKENEKRKTVDEVSATNTVCYKLDGTIPQPFYLYGTPDSKNDTRFAKISTGDFQKESNTYAAMIVDNTGKRKVARIAWATF